MALRRKREIAAAEQEFFEVFWYMCQIFMKKRIETGRANVSAGIWKASLSTEEELREKYGGNILLPKDDFEWGMINGKLSALHWALGKDWNFLDESLWEKRRTAMRQEWELLDAQYEYCDRIWFGRNSKIILNDKGEEIFIPRVEGGDIGMIELLLERYGEDKLVVNDDFEWGVWSGRLSALRWILGDEWDFLDT